MATLIKKTVNGQPRLVDVSNPTPDDMIAPTENGNTSAHAYSTGAFAKVKGVLRKVVSPISSGQAFTDTNSAATSVGEELTRINTDLSDLMGWTPLVEPFQGGGSDITLPQGCNELYIDVFCGNIHHGISIPVALITDTAQFFMVAGGYMNGTYQNYIRIALSETRYEINAAFEGGQDWRVTALNTIYYR